MSAELNKVIARRYFDELLNQGKLNVADEILSPEIVCYDPFATIHGIDRLKRFFLMAGSPILAQPPASATRSASEVPCHWTIGS